MTRPGESLTEALLDPATYRGDPFATYSALRAEAPVAWCASKGFWAISTHAEVSKISVDPERFCSSKGILVDEIGNSYDSPPTMMHTDPPAHTRWRRMIQPSFKPSSVRSLDESIRAMASALLDKVTAGEPFDLVADLAVPFPLQVICALLGADTSQWPQFFEWSEAAIPGALDISDEQRACALEEMWHYLVDLAITKRGEPVDDVVSQLAMATVDGEPLSEAELAMLLIQLLVAGNETTRNLISAGILALAENPEQLALLIEDPDRIPLAVEELLRWTTPVVSFVRTATVDSVLRGQEIAAGEAVLLLYASANRDEDVFGPSADRLDIGRNPNPHLSFGFGTHFCLGAALARLEARIALEELLSRFSSIEISRPVVKSPSPIIAGISQAIVTLR